MRVLHYPRVQNALVAICACLCSPKALYFLEPLFVYNKLLFLGPCALVACGFLIFNTLVLRFRFQCTINPLKPK